MVAEAGVLGRIGSGAAIPGRVLRAAALGASRCLGMGAQVAVQIAVGATAGPAGIGLLQLHMAWTAVLGEVVALGEPTRALRDTAVAGAAGTRARAPGRPLQRIALAGLLLALLGGLGAVAGVLEVHGSRGALLLAVLISAPLFALTRLLAESLKALDAPLRAVSLENTLAPGIILAFCALAATGLLPVSDGALLAASSAGFLASLLALAAVLRRRLGERKRAAPGRGMRATAGTDAGTRAECDAMPQTSTGVTRTPLRRRGERLHFWFSGLLNIVFLQLPFLLMPWLVGAADVGRYSVAHKLINIITTLLILLAAVYGPAFARAAADRDRAKLQGLLLATQKISLGLFLPVAALMLLCAEPLTALFSLEPGTLRTLLLLLVVGQLLNAGTGLSGVLLAMSGASHVELRIVAGSCLLTAALLWPLGASGGAEGIALACSCGIALRNAATYLAARRHLRTLGEHQP